MRKEINLEIATRLINHGPVVMVSSRYQGKTGITPVAWNMPVQRKDPVLIVLEIGEKHFIYECVMGSGDFVVNIPDISISEKVVKCGSVSGRDVDKAALCGFTLTPSRTITSPGIDESLARLECRLVKDDHLLKEYNMVVGEVKYAEAEEKVFTDHWDFSDTEFRTIHHVGSRVFCVPEGKMVEPE